MRILHTGDWHIGRKMNGLDLIDDQSYILERLMEKIESEHIDLVVVAGDIFDRANPSQRALKLANDTLYRINITLKKPLLVISGNHDSRERLNYGSTSSGYNRGYGFLSSAAYRSAGSEKLF